MREGAGTGYGPEVPRNPQGMTEKPEYSDPMEQARLEHLRAKTLLLQAQALAFTRSEPGTPRIDLASMSKNALLRLKGEIGWELSGREDQ